MSPKNKKKKERRASSPRGPVLVPVDFSAHSEAALLWAARAAHRFEAPLLLLHVVHDPGSAPGYYAATKRKKHLHRLEEAAEEMFDDFINEVRQRHPDAESLNNAEKTLVIGLPVQRILEIAESTDARLIVVGSRGRTGLPHLLLGSNAQRVAQLSPIPVTIVKDDD